MPADAIMLFLVDECPGRRVKSRVTRQWAIVEVYRAFAGQLENRLWNFLQVINAEEVVKGFCAKDCFVIGGWVDDFQSRLFGPFSLWPLGDDYTQNRVAFFSQDLSAFSKQR